MSPTARELKSFFDSLHSMTEISQITGLSLCTLWRERRRGNLGSVSLGGRVFISDEQLIAYRMKGTTPAKQPDRGPEA